MAMIARHLGTRDRAALRATCHAGWNGCDIAAASRAAGYAVVDVAHPDMWNGLDLLPADVEDRWLASATVRGREAIARLMAAVDAMVALDTPADLSIVQANSDSKRLRCNSVFSLMSNRSSRGGRISFATEALSVRVSGIDSVRKISCSTIDGMRCVWGQAQLDAFSLRAAMRLSNHGGGGGGWRELRWSIVCPTEGGLLRIAQQRSPTAAFVLCDALDAEGRSVRSFALPSFAAQCESPAESVIRQAALRLILPSQQQQQQAIVSFDCMATLRAMVSNASAASEAGMLPVLEYRKGATDSGLRLALADLSSSSSGTARLRGSTFAAEPLRLLLVALSDHGIKRAECIEPGTFRASGAMCHVEAISVPFPTHRVVVAQSRFAPSAIPPRRPIDASGRLTLMHVANSLSEDPADRRKTLRAASNANAASSARVWRCGACTFDNSLARRTCQMCDTPRRT
jgi:hypothetical protein